MERSYIVQLRFGILPIAIETGRYRSTPENERLCLICNTGTIEDESHFLFECTAYNCIRQQWFNDMNMNIQMYTNDKQELLRTIFLKSRQTAKFIIKAMDIRRNILFK